MVEATAKCTHTHICTQTQLLIWHHPDHTEIYIVHSKDIVNSTKYTHIFFIQIDIVHR